jgi:hypothetical protein
MNFRPPLSVRRLCQWPRAACQQAGRARLPPWPLVAGRPARAALACSSSGQGAGGPGLGSGRIAVAPAPPRFRWQATTVGLASWPSSRGCGLPRGGTKPQAASFCGAVSSEALAQWALSVDAMSAASCSKLQRTRHAVRVALLLAHAGGCPPECEVACPDLRALGSLRNWDAVWCAPRPPAADLDQYRPEGRATKVP